MIVTSEKIKVRFCEFCFQEGINYVRIESDHRRGGVVTLAICDKCLKELKEKLEKETA